MTKELTKAQWHDVRMTLRIIIRNKKNAKQSQLINEALDNIKDEDDRKIFKRYYIDGWGIIKITMNMYFMNNIKNATFSQRFCFTIES